jgi:hypothetical protein
MVFLIYDVRNTRLKGQEHISMEGDRVSSAGVLLRKEQIANMALNVLAGASRFNVVCA